MVDFIQRNLVTELPDGTPLDAEALLAKEDRLAHERGKRKPSWQELSPVYELRYRKGMRFTELGLVGQVSENRFANNLQYQYISEYQAVKGEQPNGMWVLVAALPKQVTTKVLTARNLGGESGRNSAPSALAELLAIKNYDHPPSIALDQQIQYEDTTDLRWTCELVFCDIARAELEDPNGREKDTLPSQQVMKYIETRQFRYMTGGMRHNRQLAEATIREFFERGDAEVPGMPDELLQPRPEQLLTAAQREMVKKALHVDGFPPAMVAALVGLSIEQLDRALDE